MSTRSASCKTGMLTARRPFGDESQRALEHRIAYEPPPALDRGLPEDLELLIGSMLAKEPSARPSSMKQVIFALDELLDDLESRAVPVAEEAAPREVAEAIALPELADAVALPEAPRRGWPVGMLGLALLAGLAGGGAKLLEQRRREGRDATSVRALEADGPQLATALEAGARTLHQRAATIAATPVLHSAIATDAATLQDLIANEHVLVAQPGERLALYHDNAEVVRVPADAPPLAPGLSRTGDGLELAVSAPIATTAGAIAVASPLDLHVISARLAGAALGAELTGLAAPLEQVA